MVVDDGTSYPKLPPFQSTSYITMLSKPACAAWTARNAATRKKFHDLVLTVYVDPVPIAQLSLGMSINGLYQQGNIIIIPNNIVQSS